MTKNDSFFYDMQIEPPNTSVMNFWMQIGVSRSVWIIDILYGILSFKQFVI